MNKQLSHKQALWFLVMAAVFWSLGGILIKSISWSPIAISGARSAFAILILMAVIRRPRFIWTGAQWGSALGYAGTVILFVAATKMTTAANAILLQYTAPIWVALLSAWFLGEPTRKIDWMVIVVVLAGMSLFFMDQLSDSHFLGNLIAVGSGIAFATMVLCMRKQKGQSTQESVLLGNILTVLIALPFMLSGDAPSTLQPWILIAVLGIFQLGLSYALYAVAIRHVTALEGILVPMIEPVLNPIWVILFYGEVPTPLALLGGLIVFAAIGTRQLLTTQR
jgi:drug/metabolite transporter (DMT)-like permease